MSGVEPRQDGQRHLVPDNAANNEFDRAAARRLYARLQELRIPLTIVTRNAAMAVRFPASFYDSLAATGHPVGIRLAAAQERAIQRLWERCHLPIGHPDQIRTPDWFRGAFCSGQGNGLTGQDRIWPAVTHLAQYDSLAVVASVPELRDRFYAPQSIRERGRRHHVIGLTPVDHGVKDVPGLGSFIAEHVRAILQQTAAAATTNLQNDQVTTP